ncbi:MAG: FkbM family methyltransferase, partial [Pseudomonadales bacterium]|nr:FkbM family methyltransferase [Pseudomonadales bacterium]
MTLIFSPRSALRTSGYFKSVALKKPCLRDGSPIPWMNYCAIHFLDERLQPDQQMFEFGSGNSTRWFAERVAQVTSVENNQQWYDYVKDTLPANVELKFQPSGVPEYANAVAASHTAYDVVVVDADERVACMLNAAGFLSARGVIVLDDAQREIYREGIEGLLEKGFRKLDLRGLKAGGIKFYSTMIFYRDGNCLD